MAAASYTHKAPPDCPLLGCDDLSDIKTSQARLQVEIEHLKKSVEELQGDLKRAVYWIVGSAVVYLVTMVLDKHPIG